MSDGVITCSLVMCRLLHLRGNPYVLVIWLELTEFRVFTQDPKVKLWSCLNAKNNFVATSYYSYEV